MIEPLMTKIIDNEEYVEISNHAAKGIKKQTYFINKNGMIFSALSNRFIIPTIGPLGYKIINLKLENGKSQVFYLHRIMMITFKFIYNYEEMQVNHINGKKYDSVLDNMEWVTLQGNNLHAKNTGLLCVGESCPWSILTEEQVREICIRLQSNEYNSITELSNEYNCSVTTIGDIARGVSWKHVSSVFNINYEMRQRFSEEQVHFMCHIFEQNKGRSFDCLYYLIIFYLNLPENRFIRRRIYKIYKKDPNNFSYITNQYNY